MQEFGIDVEMSRRSTSVVPSHLRLGTLMLLTLAEEGGVRRAQQAFPLNRGGGHRVAGLFALAVLALCAGPSWSVRRLRDGIGKRLAKNIAVIAEVSDLPSQSAFSRALGRFGFDGVHSFVRSMLAFSIDAELLSLPQAHHVDALGEPLHVVDIDPTVTTFRKRDLPEGDDLAEPKRRAYGEAGHTGRKRGELRVRVVPAIHDGTALGLAMRYVDEEGSIVPVLEHVVPDSVSALTTCGVPSEQILIRGDGELGSVGAMSTIIDAGALLLVRLSRYSLLKRDEVVARLPTLQWLSVRSGESGVKREAAELGTFTLTGTDAYANRMVTVRVVVTRLRRTSEPDHGVMQDGYQLELFATTLDPSRWSAADVSELYGGRASIENRFGQEDRELGLSHTYSYNPPGQAWMVGVGMLIWNRQIIHGWRENPIPHTPRVQSERPLADDDTPLPMQEALAVAEDEPSVAKPVEEESNPETPEPSPAPEPSLHAARQVLVPIVRAVFARTLSQVNWTYDVETASLLCPHNQRLRLYSVGNVSKAGRPRLCMRTESYACQGCPLREGCYPADRRSPYKQLSGAITVEEEKSCSDALNVLRQFRPPPPSRVPGPSHPIGPVSTLPFFEPPVRTKSGPWIPERPLFLPAAARDFTRFEASNIEIRITRHKRRPPKRVKPHLLLATDRNDRSHRRKTLTALRRLRASPDRVIATFLPKNLGHSDGVTAYMG